MEEFYIELGKQIEEGRLKKGLSRKAMASMYGVEQMTVYNWERARCRIHGLELARLVRMFKIKLNKLPE